MTWSAALGWFFAGYGLLTGIFIVLENRRPQATMAWMLLFLALPGVGLAIYLLFGRDRKAFSRESKLARQNLAATAGPLLEPLLSPQDDEIARLEGQSPIRRRLMSLVRHNSHSALTTRNRVSIQQDASVHYRASCATCARRGARSICNIISGATTPSRASSRTSSSSGHAAASRCAFSTIPSGRSCNYGEGIVASWSRRG